MDDLLLDQLEDAQEAGTEDRKPIRVVIVIGDGIVQSIVTESSIPGVVFYVADYDSEASVPCQGHEETPVVDPADVSHHLHTLCMLCPTCDGLGETVVEKADPSDEYKYRRDVPCPTCKGIGTVRTHPEATPLCDCDSCTGN